VGAVTALFAATIAVGQYDIKKVLAYSTISQLGFMVAAVGMGAYVAGMFHLVTHAFFKALLFLSAGSVILGMERGHHHLPQHAPADEHHNEVFDPGDMRNMGGLRKQMPVTFWLYITGTLALAGIFPFAGFWSKDEILLDAAKNFTLIYILLTIAAFLTAFYMGRQVWMVFFGKARHAAAEHAQESPKIITVPLMVLAGLSILGGLLNLPYVHTLSKWLEHTIELMESDFVLPGYLSISWGGLNPVVALVSTLLALLAIGLSWLLYGRKSLQVGEIDPLRKLLGPVFKVFENKYWVDELYAALFINRYVDLARFVAEKVDWNFWHDWLHDSVIARFFRWFTHFLADPIDLGIIDAISTALASLVNRSSAALRKLQNGFVRSYALSVLMGVVLILGYLLFK
jgi:NADH-quinone oxidoreductase subunit L